MLKKFGFVAESGLNLGAMAVQRKLEERNS